MTLEQLRSFILADESLATMASQGNDSGITEALNVIDGSIVVSNEYIPADYLRTLATVAVSAAMATGNAEKIARWNLASTAASGFRNPVKLTDPVLSGQLTQALSDGVLSQETIDYYTKRAGSIAEQEFGRSVLLSEVSAALLQDRPNGQIQGA